MPLFIIVFGTRWHFRDRPGGFRGHLSCPECGGTEYFVERDAFKAFTLYWWPLFRTEEGGTLVECQRCGGRFENPVLLEDSES